MAGAGRKSQYRKHLTDSVLHDFPEPSLDDGTFLAKVMATRGGNQFDILVAVTTNTTDCDADPLTATADSATDTPPRVPQLALLPTKFRKAVWVKRGDFVIVESGDNGIGTDGVAVNEATKDSGKGARYMIKHVLYKEQLKHLIQHGFWPANDPLFPVLGIHENGDGDGLNDGKNEPTFIDVSSDSIVYATNHEDDEDIDETDMQDEYLMNTNRRKFKKAGDSSDSSDDDN